MGKEIIGRGAEAVIILENNLVIKDRVSKSYRIKEIDEKIRKQRTKAEKKLLEKASKIINAPDPFPLENNFQIKMPFIEGEKISEILNSLSVKEQKEICKIAGQEIAKLHDAEIIHGDLTTSNMILGTSCGFFNSQPRSLRIKWFPALAKSLTVPASQRQEVVEGGSNKKIPSGAGGRELVNVGEPKIFFIDFGLGFISNKVEDKAVDLHLLKQALEAKHFENWKILFEEIEKGYAKSKDSEKVLERLKAVEKRGRYK